MVDFVLQALFASWARMDLPRHVLGVDLCTFSNNCCNCLAFYAWVRPVYYIAARVLRRFSISSRQVQMTVPPVQTIQEKVSWSNQCGKDRSLHTAIDATLLPQYLSMSTVINLSSARPALLTLPQSLPTELLLFGN